MTVAIYQDTEHGLLRVGTFTPRKATSVRAISDQFRKRYPLAEAAGKLYVARRINIMGRYVDQERIPFEPEVR